MGKSEDESADDFCIQVGTRSSFSVEKLDMNDIHLRNPEEPLRKMNVLKRNKWATRLERGQKSHHCITIGTSTQKEALLREVAYY